MKKMLIIIFSILLIANIFWAQENNVEHSDKNRSNSNIMDNYVETPIDMWIGGKFGLGVSEITPPDNISTSGGVRIASSIELQFNYFFISSFGINFNIGFTSFGYTLKETTSSWWEDDYNVFSIFDISLGPIFKLKSFIFYIAPFVGLKIKSTFYTDEDAKTILYGISTGFAVNIKISRKNVVPVGLEFKMTLNEPLKSLKSSRLWGIFITVGYLYGVE